MCFSLLTIHLIFLVLFCLLLLSACQLLVTTPFAYVCFSCVVYNHAYLPFTSVFVDGLTLHLKSARLL